MANDPGTRHPNAADRSSGEASGKHQGMYRPDENREASDALENVSLKDRGTLMEDHLRANDYDDSIEPTGDRKGIARGD